MTMSKTPGIQQYLDVFFQDSHANKTEGMCSLSTLSFIPVRSFKYTITCIQRLPMGNNKSGLLQQVVFKCRFYQVDLTHSHTMTSFDAPGKLAF